ncbi:hypothetical protein [Haloarchaeobius sp. FL176]|uniref:hypothetical protein n=1 Tax=Haloarchaeobius sp. FL176 TaxID=2967129 RepID=UPI0021484AC6|nr:hypothetical protein [Haloarchaeobius sp. FL176]
MYSPVCYRADGDDPDSDDCRERDPRPIARICPSVGEVSCTSAASPNNSGKTTIPYTTVARRSEVATPVRYYFTETLVASSDIPPALEAAGKIPVGGSAVRVLP